MYVEDERDTMHWLPWDNCYRKHDVVYHPREIKTAIEYNNIYYNDLYDEAEDDEYVEETTDDSSSNEEDEMNAELLDNKEFAYT